jgi:hypothetical protein
MEWRYTTAQIVRWHFNVIDVVLLAGCALVGGIGELGARLRA